MAKCMVRIRDLPKEALIRVFAKLPVRDIPIARRVCANWKRIITEHGAEIWKTKCSELNILPDGYNTVLSAYASETRRRARITELREVAEVYRGHFLAWQPHVCVGEDLDDPRALTNPLTFRWVCSPGEWSYSHLVRKIHWSWPSALPSCWRASPVLYRLEDILKIEQLKYDVHRARVLEIKLIQAGKVTT